MPQDQTAGKTKDLFSRQLSTTLLSLLFWDLINAYSEGFNNTSAIAWVSFHAVADGGSLFL